MKPSIVEAICLRDTCFPQSVHKKFFTLLRLNFVANKVIKRGINLSCLFADMWNQYFNPCIKPKNWCGLSFLRRDVYTRMLLRQENGYFASYEVPLKTIERRLYGHLNIQGIYKIYIYIIEIEHNMKSILYHLSFYYLRT